MAPRLKPRLGYANVASTLALVLAGSGTAYAAATVNSKDVVDDSLKSVDLRDGAAVKGRDVADNTLSGDDIDESTLSKVRRASRAGVAGYQRVYGGNQPLGPNATATFSVDCPGGTVAVSGGTWSDFFDVETAWAYVDDDDSYTAAFWNTSNTTRTVGVHVVCVKG